MPPASRRSGTAHTSKASRRSDVDERHNEISSSSVMMESDELLSSSQQQQQQPIQTTGRGRNVDDITKLLQRFDQEQEPLSKDASDSTLRTLKGDWAGMEANFEIVYNLILEVAERLADARAAEGLTEEDENLERMDVGMRGMIDLHEKVTYRKKALEEIRAEVARGDVPDAKAMYETKVQDLEDNYCQKTSRQKYLQSNVYRRYKTAVWGALRDEDMPPLADLLPYEQGDDDGEEDDDDIVAFGGDKIKYKCPISLRIMEDPLSSKICKHSFERQSILDYLKQGPKSCPAGCGKILNMNVLKQDAAFIKECHKFARREQFRSEKQKTQVQATDLD